MDQDEGVRSNGHALRTAETRANLIAAAIAMFGDGGFDAVSTRELADKAKVGVAAIAYHFGGKAELFEAAVTSIEDYCRDLTSEVSDQLEADAPAEPAERLTRAVRAYFQILFGGDEPQSWVNFLVRCSVDAPEAYDLLYEAAFRPLEVALTLNLAAHRGVSPQEEDVRLRAYIATHSIVSMRTNRGAFLRHLGWKELGPNQIHTLEGIVTSLVNNALMLDPVADETGPTGKRRTGGRT